MNSGKRLYKTQLDPAFDEETVCYNTRQKWKKKVTASMVQMELNNAKEGVQLLEETNDINAVQGTNAVYETSSVDEDFSQQTSSEDGRSFTETVEDKSFEPFAPEMQCKYQEDLAGKNEVGENSSGDYARVFGVDSNVSRHKLTDDNRVMFERSGLTVGQVVSAAVAFGLRFHQTQTERSFFFDFLKMLAGPEFADLNISNYKISMAFDPPNDKITYHFYCTLCHIRLHSSTKKQFKNCSILCRKCKEMFELSFASSNLFLRLNLKHQIQMLLERPDVRKHLLEAVKLRHIVDHSDNISDIQDGRLHKNLVRDDPEILTFNTSLDGAPANNAKTGFWPHSVILNDLPPEIRFKNILLAGVMVVKKEPTPALLNLFLESFVEECNELSTEGIDIMENGRHIKLRFALLCCPLDSAARPVVQNRAKYNAFYGCSYCRLHGKHAGGAVKFPYVDKPVLRSHETNFDDVLRILKTGSLEKSHGVKGPCVLSRIPTFDMIWGFPVEYLHNVVIGSAKRIPELWEYLKLLSLPVRKIIDERLMTIQPSKEIYRLPYKFSERGAWKATHWKAWLLFFSIPICIDLIQPDVLRMYALFVRSIFILLKKSISQDELCQCERDLDEFVHSFQILGDTPLMRFNIHLAQHLVQSVRHSGPLWSNSAFPYEGFIFCLKQLANGTKGIDQQMAKNSLKLLRYKCNIADTSLPPIVNEYIESLFTTKKKTASAYVTEDVVFFGKGQIATHDLFPNAKLYNKCIYKHHVLHSVNYNRTKRFNDTIVELKNGTIVQIVQIIKTTEEKCYLLATKIRMENLTVGNNLPIVMPHIFSIQAAKDEVVIPINEVIEKVMVLDFGTKHVYLCKYPNTIEGS